ncbi:hypothetical protein [Photobacterium sp. 1_MG-2023]|uniref:hypothetical protein n=1 Tax=Photobacterium sp. 1_MG-2023 TaxID=3062646 RepID=UPI0026E3D1CC|nr:hypothetical protein [Photobacterium sp. 1_MG-2023]MDO6705825.1 hypothetical protein [Photobacterium sp. 1_MG-2023]
MKSTIRFIFTLCVLLFTSHLYASDNQPCSEASKSILLLDLSHQGFADKKFDAIACKILPHKQKKMFASYLKNMTQVGHGDRYVWRVLVIDQSSGKIESSYRDEVQEDGGIRVSPYSIKLDTARYHLNETTRALGVRLMIGTAPRCADSSMTDFLSLFVEKDSELTPVLLNLPTNLWQRLEGDHCTTNDDLLITTQSHVFLSFLKDQTQGYRDIRITTKVEKSTDYPFKNIHESDVTKTDQTLRFDGKFYQATEVQPTDSQLLKDVYENLDITTFRSSLMPKRIGNENRFPEFESIPKPVYSEKMIVMESEYWYYALTLTKENHLGYHFCFVDKSTLGTYFSTSSLLLRKYGNRYVALNFEIDACE